MNKFYESKLFQAGIWILLIFLIILIGTQISFIFRPFIIIFNTLFFPFLIAGFLYFLVHPFVDWVDKRKVPRGAAIALIYLLFFGLLLLLATLALPPLQREVTRLISDIPDIISQLNEMLMALQDNPVINRLMEEEPDLIERTAQQLTGFLDDLVSLLIQNIASFFEFAADLFIVVVAVPFILFYMLKDGHRWPEVLFRYVPEEHEEAVQNTLREMNWAIGSYIQGIFMVCLGVGIMVYIGFLIIGMDYPLLLAIFAMLTNVIPFLGPILGAIPAIIVGLLHSPFMLLKVIIVMVIVQQAENLFISPQVMGKKLAIGPLTVILVVLVAGRMAGFLGMILALPTYVILKIVVNHLYKFIATSIKKQ